ncbi:MAG: hypothetical protein D6694_08865, partial [Gammaproteobacteria bacterium]
DDPLINEYIRSIGFKLVAANQDAAGRRFDFTVLKPDVINAFALPGGYIAIYAGLMLKAEIEDEVAGVLAHEIAHVTQRHIARRYEKAQQLQLPTLLAVIGSLIAGASNPQAAAGGLAASLAGQQQLLLNYSRANEAEADRIGFRTLAEAGFDPRGMASFFEKLAAKYRHSPRPLEFLLTHPLPERRAADAKLRLEDIAPFRQHSQYRFWLIQERLRALVSPDGSLTDEDYRRAVKVDDKMKQRAVRHGYGVWLTRQGRAAEAMNIAKALYRTDPNVLENTVLYIDVLTEGGHLDDAITVAQKALSISPMNYPLMIAYSRALLKAGQAKEAMKQLLALAYRQPDDVLTLELLARAQHEAGQEAESHETTALYLHAIGDLKGAQLHYRKALRGRSDDPYFFTRVRGRLAALEAEMIELRAQRH